MVYISHHAFYLAQLYNAIAAARPNAAAPKLTTLPTAALVVCCGTPPELVAIGVIEADALPERDAEPDAEAEAEPDGRAVGRSLTVTPALSQRPATAGTSSARNRISKMNNL
jgi:hypothetical protein